MFGVQLYKNNARALLSHILSILKLDWLQHGRSVRGVYEFDIMHNNDENDERIKGKGKLGGDIRVKCHA